MQLGCNKDAIRIYCMQLIFYINLIGEVTIGIHGLVNQKLQYDAVKTVQLCEYCADRISNNQ
jgi:hypothetical protein